MKGKLTKGNLRGVPCAALISASLLLTGVSGALVAQEESASRIEEVVVTARKRAESIQDVPVALHIGVWGEHKALHHHLGEELESENHREDIVGVQQKLTHVAVGVRLGLVQS